MKQKVSDYIAEYIAQWGIRDVFTVTGGGAMHMNDAFGHHKMLHCTYQHHEQACAMAAEAYARLGNKMAAVCVTTGPGATNAITGVLGAWMDSIPMLVFSSSRLLTSASSFRASVFRQEIYLTIHFTASKPPIAVIKARIVVICILIYLCSYKERMRPKPHSIQNR